MSVCVCVCMCVCVRVCECVYVCAHACVGACVLVHASLCARLRAHVVQLDHDQVITGMNGSSEYMCCQRECVRVCLCLHL